MLTLQNVGKGFHKKNNINSKSSFQTMIGLILNRKSVEFAEDRFWALKDISFEITRGESLGVIGVNGSGKTTLMKLICGLLLADEGTVENGFRTQQMINLGAGFDPDEDALQNLETELSLRNIPKNKHKELIYQIIKFAELEEFQETSVGKYSSGMAARLGFSLCIHTNPELLIIDEALSVGDERFRIKCLAKMQELRDRGVSMIFVSHSMTHVSQFCDKAIWINKGNLVSEGPVRDVIEEYMNFIYDDKSNNVEEPFLVEEEQKYLAPVDSATLPQRISSNLVDIDFREGDSPYGILVAPTEDISNIWFKFDSDSLETTSSTHIELGFDIHKPISELNFTLNFLTESFELVTAISSLNFDLPKKINPGRFCYKVEISRLCLVPGKYFIIMPIHNGPSYLFRGLVWQFSVSLGESMTWGKFFMPHKITSN